MAALVVVSFWGCTNQPSATLVTGPGGTGSQPPTLNFTAPTNNTTIAQGSPFQIQWTDADPDSSALILFRLVDAEDASNVLLLAEGIQEDDSVGPSSINVSTDFIPEGQYFLEGVISDGRNAPVSVFATNASSGNSRLLVTIAGESFAPANTPPVIVVTQPAVNVGVAQDDVLNIAIAPSRTQAIPFDPDNNTTVYISLDFDTNTMNDDPTRPVSATNQYILLSQIDIAMGATAAGVAPINVDLSTIVPRPNGDPYFIRATITDGINPPVTAYADGSLSVFRFVRSGELQSLGAIGRTRAGAVFLGFDPEAFLGNHMTGGFDFDFGVDLDGDGQDDPSVDDFVLAAKGGVPTGRGNVGEGYLVYGQNNQRLGGVINVNSVGATIPGATFYGPTPNNSTETEGLDYVTFIPDLSGDGRPEISFSYPYVDGAPQFRDDDPDDTRGTAVGGEPVEQITLVIRQGEILEFNENQSPDDPMDVLEAVNIAPGYNGVVDTVIDASAPNSNFNDLPFLDWEATNAGDMATPQRYTLIKFDNLRFTVPDFVDFEFNGINIVSARLTLEITENGDDGELHPLLTDFSASTTFGNFAEDGGEDDPTMPPLGGPVEGIDYTDDRVVVPGDRLGEVNIGVNQSGEDFGDEQIGSIGLPPLGWIIIPMGDDMLPRATEFRSSETPSALIDMRPTLRIVYTRELGTDDPFNTGCYPDLLPNNYSDNPTNRRGADLMAACGGDTVFTPGDRGDDKEDQMVFGEAGERLGVVAMFMSENVDQDGSGNAGRLVNAQVETILSGQRNNIDCTNGLRRGAVDPEEPGRIRGARFQAAMYDLVDASNLNQGPIRALMGKRVDWTEDINNDGQIDLIISAPRNELDIEETIDAFGFSATHVTSRLTRSNVTIFFGTDYSADIFRETDGEDGTASFPRVSRLNPLGSCPPNEVPRGLGPETLPRATIFGEKPTDMLGDAGPAGDFNLDGNPDFLMGAPFADPNIDSGGVIEDAGTTYVVYGRQLTAGASIRLADADDFLNRPPMLRIFGEFSGDRIGSNQERIQDLNGDRIPDIMFSSPYADVGGLSRPSCSTDFFGRGNTEPDDVDLEQFEACAALSDREGEVFFGDACKFFDYNNDRKVDSLDRDVFFGDAACPIDNGVVGIVFGGIQLDGDRDVSQIGTSDLPGTLIVGTNPGDRAGHDISSAGDFNRDGFGDILITAPGEIVTNSITGERFLGAVYLIFGGPHLGTRNLWRLSQVDDGTANELPGIKFVSPYGLGRPNEAPPLTVARLGDINNDNFTDIAIGNPFADFVDDLLPQQPGQPGTPPAIGRRINAGEVYVIYGNP